MRKQSFDQGDGMIAAYSCYVVGASSRESVKSHAHLESLGRASLVGVLPLAGLTISSVLWPFDWWATLSRGISNSSDPYARRCLHALISAVRTTA